MMLGLWAGAVAEDTAQPDREKLQGLVLAGIALTLAGLVLQWLGLCPIVKRIWTSSYTLYSGGLVVLILSGVLRGDRPGRVDALDVSAASSSGRTPLPCTS